MDKGLKVLKTGTVLDDLMDGISTGMVTTIFGFPGSGKTTICLEVAKEFEKNGKVAFIDADSGFSAVRLKQIGGNGKNILVFSPESWEEQIALLDKIEKMEPELVIVDTVISLFKLEDLETRDLARYFKSLTKLAKGLDIPVLATNQAYEWEGRTGMVNKTISEYWSKAVVFIEKLERPNFRRLVLKKHLWLPEAREITAEITAEGFKRRKFGFFV